MAVHHAPTRDPRSVVTPDAFSVSPDLLGMPLATPMRRLWALLIDLVVIGVVTVVTKSFALVLGVVAAVFFVRVSLKRTSVPGSAFGRAMRFSLGCLGVFIGVVTAIVWLAVGMSGFGDPDVDTEEVVQEALEDAGISFSDLPGLGDALSVIQRSEAFRNAADRDAAVEAGAALARTLQAAGSSPSESREALEDLAPDDAPWSNRVDEVVSAAQAAAGGTEPAGPGTEAGTEAGADTATESASAPEDDARLALLDSVAADTLGMLNERVEDLEEDLADSEERVQELRTELGEEREGGGFFAFLRSIVDELGFGFGWASLYLTVMLSWWKGQTVGKHLMGVRVLRLDGQPITWWTAFERAGGYAAGFATGLLGFAQVFWDANRQAIHDRIVGTVVVVEGGERVVDWEEAL
jgi:hypothetical protein